MRKKREVVFIILSLKSLFPILWHPSFLSWFFLLRQPYSRFLFLSFMKPTLISPNSCPCLAISQSQGHPPTQVFINRPWIISLVKFEVIKNTLGDCIYSIDFLATLYGYMKMVELSEIMIVHYTNAWHYFYHTNLFAFKYR